MCHLERFIVREKDAVQFCYFQNLHNLTLFSSCSTWRIAVTRSRDIPYFGPSIPEGAVFDKDDQFREFLLAKRMCMNGTCSLFKNRTTKHQRNNAVIVYLPCLPVYLSVCLPVYLSVCLTVINACNASLRSEKFSGMAIRTRKQYLTDLAENSTTGLNIDQANNSGIVGRFVTRLIISCYILFLVYNYC